MSTVEQFPTNITRQTSDGIEGVRDIESRYPLISSTDRVSGDEARDILEYALETNRALKGGRYALSWNKKKKS